MSYQMRVTQRSLIESSIHNIQVGMNRLGRAQEQIGTGKVINRPSDSPSGTNQAMFLRSEIATLQRYNDAAGSGLSWLAQVDSTLSGVVDTTNRVRVLTVQGLNSGALGDSARAAIAAEVTQLRDALLSEANTTFLGRPLFGGTTTGNVAYDEAGNYVGDGGGVTRDVGGGTPVRVDVSGPQVFGTGATSLFAVLDDIATHLVSDPSALAGDLDRLDALAEGIRNAHAEAGTRAAYLEDVRGRIDTSVVGLTASLSQVEDVDLAEASMQLSMAEISYQAALAATARVVQPSLVDFLR